MLVLIFVLVFIVCILLMAVILIQNPKGGGLSSSFSSTGQIMGVRKTTDFLEKATWTLAIALLVLSLLSAAVSSGEQERPESELQEYMEQQQPVVPPAGYQQPQQVPAPQQPQ